MFKLEIEPSETLHTIWGNAKSYEKGYFVITSRKDGHNHQFLHRLIWEKEYGEIPNDFQIHHIDGNKKNNCLMNLKAIPSSEHKIIHTKGKQLSNETKINMSKSKNTTGFFRVYKRNNHSVKQGFVWVYRCYENGKRLQIVRVNIDDLEREVKNRGLEWEMLSDGN